MSKLQTYRGRSRRSSAADPNAPLSLPSYALSTAVVGVDCSTIAGSDGDLISTVPDWATPANALTASGGLRPTLKINIVGGKSVLRFSAGNYIRAPVWSGPTTFSHFIVINQSTTDNSGQGLWDTAPSTAHTWRNYALGNANYHDDANIFTRIQGGNAGAGLFILEYTVTNNPSIIIDYWLNGYYFGQATNAGTTAIAWNGLTIGSVNLGGTNWVGDLCEMLICNVRLDASVRKRIRDYYFHKWFIGDI